ncbi:hypothetical protein [Nocardioides sp. LHG3406-4]|uniref:hypothetical protein n=1 Tax=Nocardioides sp. LHG3406-4 TaxID=2804575 RepID=UPI003CF102C0
MDVASRAEHPIARDEWLAAYVDVTPFDLAVDAFMAATVEEVERVEFLALLLVGFPAMHRTPVLSPAGKTSGPLAQHLQRARGRIGAHHDSGLAEKFEAHREHADAARKADKDALWREREERIRRLGFIKATA